ncbi:hypothetical protein QUA40_17015 [Microcoleus sp. Pol11C3]|uniref:hypothetical protein n=1 Tax=Microcoleus sp. Pol11C3 TaxID=3055390 RepID=UPI002FD50345
MSEKLRSTSSIARRHKKRSIVRASQLSWARARNSSSFPRLTSIGLRLPERPLPHNSPKVFATGVSPSQSSQV